MWKKNSNHIPFCFLYYSSPCMLIKPLFNLIVFVNTRILSPTTNDKLLYAVTIKYRKTFNSQYVESRLPNGRWLEELIARMKRAEYPHINYWSTDKFSHYSLWDLAYKWFTIGCKLADDVNFSCFESFVIRMLAPLISERTTHCIVLQSRHQYLTWVIQILFISGATVIKHVYRWLVSRFNCPTSTTSIPKIEDQGIVLGLSGHDGAVCTEVPAESTDNDRPAFTPILMVHSAVVCYRDKLAWRHKSVVTGLMVQFITQALEWGRSSKVENNCFRNENQCKVRDKAGQPRRRI